MRRLLACLALVCMAVGPAWAGTFPWGGPRPSREPHPTVVALRDCTATLRTSAETRNPNDTGFGAVARSRRKTWSVVSQGCLKSPIGVR